MASRLVTSANKMTLRDVIPGAQALSELTISSGSVTATRGQHTIDTENDDPSDNLFTIVGTNFRAGDTLLISAANTARTVVVKASGGNIRLQNDEDINLDDDEKTLLLRFDGTNWNYVAGAGLDAIPDYIPNASAATELTIASGSITPTRSAHTVDTESDASTDDLVTIVGTNFKAGDRLTLSAAHGSRDVVVKASGGNILLPNDLDITLDDTEKTVDLRFDGTNWNYVSGPISLLGDTDTPTKFTNSDATPSVAGRDTWQFADTPVDITMFDNMIDGETKYVEPPSSTQFRILTSGGLVTPGSQSLIVSPGDPVVRLRKRGGTIRVDMIGPPRRSALYGAEAVTISSGTAAPTRTVFVLAGEGAVADNLVAITVTNRFKAGEELTCIIDQLPGKGITVVHGSSNITTPNGKNYTFSAKKQYAIATADTTIIRKEIYFRVNAAGTGVELLPKGFTEWEKLQEPLGANDVVMVTDEGQSNADRGTTTGAAASTPEGSGTPGAMTHVRMLPSGSFDAWEAFDTSSSPYRENNNVEDASDLYAGVGHSLAQKWEDSFTTLSLKQLNLIILSQGGKTFSALKNTDDASSWNPDRSVSTSSGTPSGTWPLRLEGEKDGDYSLFHASEQSIYYGKKALEDEGKHVRFFGIWIHGESDALESDTAAEYRRHLQRRYASICKAAGMKVPWFIVLLRSAEYAQRAVVQEAMLSFARSEPLVDIIDPFDLPSYNASDTGSPSNFGIYAGDGVHLDKQACDEIADEIINRTVKAGFFGGHSDDVELVLEEGSASVTITEGTYTPTLTNGANIDSSSVAGTTLYYQRIGSTVYVRGMLTIDTTAGGNASTALDVSLPIASNFTSSNDLSGFATTGQMRAARLAADVTNDRVDMTFFSEGTAAANWAIFFAYTVK